MCSQELTAERAYEIMKRISDEDCQVMGFNPKFAHPSWMVLTVLPVPPPAVRPSVQMDSNSRCIYRNSYHCIDAKVHTSNIE